MKQKKIIPMKCIKCGRETVNGDCYGCEADRLREALWVIANMQVTENTNHEELSALCISIAKITIAA